jgi:hypothetical protein
MAGNVDSCENWEGMPIYNIPWTLGGISASLGFPDI